MSSLASSGYCKPTIMAADASNDKSLRLETQAGFRLYLCFHSAFLFSANAVMPIF